MFTKFIHVKNPLNQSITCLSTKEKRQGLKMKKIQGHFLIIHKQLMISMKIEKAIIHKRKELC